ncbi:hypothetical protein DPI70_23990 [Escherichia coli]|nr:hypothetical protein [Escherichia coli]
MKYKRKSTGKEKVQKNSCREFVYKRQMDTEGEGKKKGTVVPMGTKRTTGYNANKLRIGQPILN